MNCTALSTGDAMVDSFSSSTDNVLKGQYSYFSENVALNFITPLDNLIKCHVVDYNKNQPETVN